ncbi:hypothetical protein F4779DRAFT_579239 [Xylariaceae sp. FL0662B]|nr:hypothetical protein F4779DRAFT_579239 [Xylariaceae sp. FL0662B]
MLPVSCRDAVPESRCSVDMKVIRQAWTSFITVTLITTLGQPAIPAFPANPTSTSPATTSTLIETSPVFTNSPVSTSNETPSSRPMSTSASTSEFSPSTNKRDADADPSNSGIPISSSTSFSSTLAESGGTQDVSMAPDTSPPRAKRTSQQTTAIIASVVSVTAFLVILAALLRYFMIRRRQFRARQRQQRKLVLSPLNNTETNTSSQPRNSTTDTRSSIWGDAVRVVIRRPSLGTDLLDHRLWPIPPGHPGWLTSIPRRNGRFTFFMGNSIATGDDIAESEQWSTNSQDGSGNTETTSDSDSESVWGMPGTSRAHG